MTRQHQRLYHRSWTFTGCTSLTYIELPRNSLNTISDGAFFGCSNLTYVDISRPTNTRNGLIIDSNKRSNDNDGDDGSRYCYSRYNPLTGARIKLPNNIKAVSPFAFDGCNRLDGLISYRSIVFACDTYRIRQFFSASVNATHVSLRPYILNERRRQRLFKLQDAEIDFIAMSRRCGEENNNQTDHLTEKKIRHLSFIYFLLVNDSVMWGGRRERGHDQ